MTVEPEEEERHYEGQEAVVEMGEIYLALVNHGTKRQVEETCGKKSVTPFNPKQRKNCPIVTSRQQRFRCREKDTGWTLPLPGKIQGTEDIKLEMAEKGRPERGSKEEDTKSQFVGNIFKDEEPSELGEMKIWKKVPKDGLKTKADHV